MNKRIDKLTPEQEAYLPEFREQWLQRGIATGPCDRKAIEASVGKLYACKNLAPPKFVCWMNSPLGGVFAVTVLTSPNLRANLRASNWWIDGPAPHIFNPGGFYFHVATKPGHGGAVYRVRCWYAGTKYKGRETESVSIGFKDGKLHWIVRVKAK